MKLSLVSIATVLSLCTAQADTELRKRPNMGGGGRGGGGGVGRLQAMIEAQCSDPTTTAATCENVPDDLDCTFQEPEKPDTSGMDVDTRAQARAEYQAKKKECRQNMVMCHCCEGVSIEDILAARGDAGGSRPFGGGGGGGGGGRPGRPGMGGGGLFGGSGGGTFQSMIEERCGDDSICDGVEPDSLTCTFEKPELEGDISALDADGRAQLKEQFKAKMEEQREEMAKCVCCAGMSVEDVLAAARPLGGGFGGRPGGKPGGMGGFGGGGGGMDIEAKLEEACSRDDAKEKCSEMETQVQSMDCSKFDLMMSNLDSTGDDIDSMIGSNTRGGRRKNFFYCGCCR